MKGHYWARYGTIMATELLIMWIVLHAEHVSLYAWFQWVVLGGFTFSLFVVGYGAGWGDGHQAGYRKATAWWASRIHVVPTDMMGWLTTHRWVWQRREEETTEDGTTLYTRAPE